MKKIYTAAILAMMLLLGVAAASAATPAADKTLAYGARGDDVKMVQKLLADTGYYAGQIDGVFGGATLQAVKEFQAYHGLETDGKVGRETIAFLQRERSSAEPDRYSRVLTMTASAYTAQDSGNSSTTYRGHELRRGLAAVDPGVIPLGTRLFVKGYGYAVADDVGGAIHGNRIDLAFESRADALQFGVQKVTVYILD